MIRYVFDTSALFALRHNEPGAAEVEAILKDRSAERYLSFISITEFFYITWQRKGKEEAYQAIIQLKMLPLQRVDPQEELLLQAGEFKALHSLSLADSLIAATALQMKATLVHKDPEFEQLRDRLSLQALPYKG